MEVRVGVGRKGVEVEIIGREGIEVEVIWGVNSRVGREGLGVIGRSISKIWLSSSSSPSSSSLSPSSPLYTTLIIVLFLLIPIRVLSFSNNIVTIYILR